MTRFSITGTITLLLFGAAAAKGNWRTTLDVANQFRDNGSAAAENEYRKAEEQAETEKSEGIAIVWNDWAVCLINHGEYQKAESLLNRSLEFYRQREWDNTAEAGAAMYNLALAKRILGRREEAESLQLRSLAIFENNLSPKNPAMPLAMSGLGMLYLEIGRSDEARTLLKRAIEIAKETLGAQDPFVASRLLELSEIQRQSRDYDSARLSVSNAIRILDQSPKLDPHQSGVALNQLARIEYEMGHYHDAEKYWQKTLDILLQIRPATDEEVLGVRASLARIMALDGNTGKSEQSLWSIVHAAEDAGSTISLAAALRFLAADYVAHRRYDLARPLLLRSLALIEQQVGAKSVGTAICLQDLVATLLAMNRPEEAEPFSRRAVAAVEQMKSVAPSWVELLDMHSHVLHKLKRRREEIVVARQVKELKDANPAIPRQTIDVIELAHEGRRHQ